jgi:hypothetical protein
MELAMTTVGEGPVAPDATPADALEQPREEVDPLSAARSPAPGLRPADFHDPGPEGIGDRRVGPPWSGSAGLVRAPVAADPAVVERVHEDHPDATLGESGLGGKQPRADGPERIAREETDRGPDRRRVDLEGVGWLGRAPEAEGGMTAGIGLLVEFGRVRRRQAPRTGSSRSRRTRRARRSSTRRANKEAPSDRPLGAHRPEGPRAVTLPNRTPFFHGVAASETSNAPLVPTSVGPERPSSAS